MTSTTASDPATPPPPGRTVPTVWGMLVAFSLASLSGFGGVLPFARRMMVEEKRWLTAEEFNEMFSLAQFVPGPNMLNLAVVFGARNAGAIGAIAATCGLLIPPVMVVMVLGALYAQFGELPALQGILKGLAAAAAGLIIAAALRMIEPLFRKAAGPAPYVAAVLFLGVGILRIPMLWALAAILPVSIALAWWWRRS